MISKKRKQRRIDKSINKEKINIINTGRQLRDDGYYDPIQGFDTSYIRYPRKNKYTITPYRKERLDRIRLLRDNIERLEFQKHRMGIK